MTRLLAVLALLAAAGASAVAIFAPVMIAGEPAPRSTAPATSPPAPRPAAPASAGERDRRSRPRPERRRPRPRSVALGSPTNGALRDGVRLPASGRGFVSWDPILRRAPGRAWRRHGTDRLVELLERIAVAHARAHPGAPPLVIGDLSRPRGGDFGARYGIVGHVSHQNGLDVDIYYPRRDGRPAPPSGPADIDRPLTRALIRRLLAASPERLLVSPALALGRTGSLVAPASGHDDHLHLRIADR